MLAIFILKTRVLDVKAVRSFEFYSCLKVHMPRERARGFFIRPKELSAFTKCFPETNGKVEHESKSFQDLNRKKNSI